MSKTDNETIIIKKYANRRLYDTSTSVYITLEDLSKMVRVGTNFMVIDAKSGDDLTRQVLTQIILEQENKGSHVLPTEFLRDVIRFYNDDMRDVLQHYLAASMQSFLTNQEKMRGVMGKAAEGFSPFNQFEELTRHNVALFERAFSLFNPFGADKDKKR